jgi:hypothetical protein
MQEPAEKYLSTGYELLLKAEEALEEGDLLQASEKFWGASAQMAKAVAAQRGWDHSSHTALFRVIDQLALELGEPGLRKLFLEAGQLHTNFYENWLPVEMVRSGRESVRELLDRLERVL